MEKRASRFNSSSTEPTVINRSDSEERILSSAQGNGNMFITKTTRIEVQEYDADGDALNKSSW